MRAVIYPLIFVKSPWFFPFHSLLALNFDKIDSAKTLTREDPVKTSFWHHLFFIALLGSATVLLPACGGNAVKSSDNSTPRMNAEATPDTTMKSSTEPSSVPMNSYVEKSSSKSKSTESNKTTGSPVVAAPTPMPTLATVAATPVVETPAPVQKSGSHFLWWLLLILILAGIGWYFWSKNHSDEDEFQPHPPSGGLSPVSGYTGTKHLEADEKKAPSIWTRKLF
jgi:hypothetical protein